MKRTIAKFLFTGMFALTLALASNAQEMTDGDMMAKEKMKPVVAVISAEWCPYCKNVEPVIMKLMKEYGEKMRFVVFDVTNDSTAKEAMMRAEELGLSKFFKDHKAKTSTVAVLKGEKVLFKTSNNTKREDYVKAFNAALN